MSEIKRCQCCGAKIIEYRNTLNKSMVDALRKLYLNGGKAHLQNDLDITKNQYNNFQKLQYWDLVKKHYDASGERASGVWEVTSHGEDFLTGKIKIHRNVITYRSVRKEYTGGLVSIQDYFDTNYMKINEYIETSRCGKETLFD